MVGLVSNPPLIIQARSFLWPLLARLFYYLSPTQGVCPYLTILAWTARTVRIFCFPLYQNAFVIEKDDPNWRTSKKWSFARLQKNKCFVWNYVIQDMVSSNKYKILIRSENCGDHQLSDLGYIHREKSNNSSHQPRNSDSWI